MNTFRTHKDSARFGITEYSDMSHSEFLATKLNGDLTKATANRRINYVTEKPPERRRTNPYNIIRYTRDTIGDADSLPMKIDWYATIYFPTAVIDQWIDSLFFSGGSVVWFQKYEIKGFVVHVGPIVL